MDINFVKADTKERLAFVEDVYMEAFPENERKLFSMLVDRQAKGDVEILMIELAGMDAGQEKKEVSGRPDEVEIRAKEYVPGRKDAVGEVILAEYENVVLLDYFAVRDVFRGQGIGANILQKLQERCRGKRLLLEIESTKVEAENIKQRLSRKKFYERCGMRCMDYSADVLGVEMEVLTFGCEVGFAEYRAVYEQVYGAEIGAQIRLVGEDIK